MDYNETCIELLKQRISESDIKNINVLNSKIENFTGSIDCAMGLHCCGEATDEIILISVKHNIPFILSPCCIGKINIRDKLYNKNIE